MLILSKYDETQALKVIERTNQKINVINESKTFPFRPRMSYGFAEFNPNNPLNIDELIKIADEKVYKMKKEHKSKDNSASS